MREDVEDAFAFIEQGQTGGYKFNFRDVIRERKLDRALRDTHVNNFKEYETFHPSDPTIPINIQMLLEKLGCHPYNFIYESYGYACFLEDILLSCEPTPAFVKMVNKIIAPLKATVKDQFTYMLTNYNLQEKDKVLSQLNQKLDSLLIPDEVLKLLSVGGWLTEHVGEVQRIIDVPLKPLETYATRANKCNTASTVSKNFTGLDYMMHWSKEIYLLINMETDDCFVCPLDYNLLLCNKVHDLVSVLMLIYYGSGIIYPHNAYQTYLTFIKTLIKLNKEYKNKYYIIAKSLEALATAEILHQVEDWTNATFLESVQHELMMEIKFNYPKSDLARLLRSVTPNFKYELGCASKLLGHPYVSMRAGADAMYKKANAEYTLDFNVINEVVCRAKLDFVTNWVLTKKKWPLVEFTSKIPEGLVYACLRNLVPNDKKVPQKLRDSYQLSDWMYVELQKVEEFRRLENTIPYLKDRTISTLREKVDPRLLEDDNTSNYIPWQETRLLLAYLMHENLDKVYQDYLKKYETCATLDDLVNYLLIRVVPKEKELKEKFRGFGCKTYEDRMRCLAQEKSAVVLLEKYYPGQAMALDELALNRKLVAFRRMPLIFENHTTLYISIDASSWCSHWRSEVVDTLGAHVYDKIFGTNIYCKTQQAYEKSLIYIPDSREWISWEGQKGGIEGLNQDTWVMAYLDSIATAMSKFPYKYYVICRGDDLRIAIAIPNSDLRRESISIIKNRILVHLSEFLAKVGHEIKINDSYGSSVFFAFCKQASIKDLELSQATRKCQKSYGANNATLETLDEYTASAFSNCHSAAKTCSSPLPCYMLAIFWFLYDLLRHPVFKNCTEDELIAYTLIPSLTGGFPIIYLHNFYTRAESDLLTPFIELYQFMRHVRKPVANLMERYMTVQRKVPSSLEALYNDPYSLCHNRPPLPTGYLRSRMPQALKRITKNAAIRELLDVVEKKSDESALKALDSSNIVQARAFNVLYSAFPRSILSSITKMFESSKSVLQLLCGQNKRRMSTILRNAVRVENELQNWRLSQFRLDHYLINGRKYVDLARIDCPLQAADRIREYAWGKPVFGVSMPTMVHQMSYYDTQTAPIGNKHVDNNHFTYEMLQVSYRVPGEDSDHFASGGNTPFVGFKTRPGTQLPQYHFVEHDLFLSKLKNAAEIMYWFSTYTVQNGQTIPSNLPDFINKLVNSYTSDEFESWLPFIGKRRSGTPEHHLQSSGFRASIVPNMTVNRYTQVRGRTDTHRTLVYQSDKYKINLLQIMCSATSLLTCELDVGQTISRRGIKIWGVTTDCKYCTTPIKDQIVILDPMRIERIKLKPLKAMKISSSAAQIFQESAAKYDMNQHHNLIALLDIDIKSASLGVLYEEFNAHKTLMTSIQAVQGSHVPTAQSLDAIQTMSLSKTFKNTSVTELKAIPVTMFAQCLSQLITSEIFTYYPTFYTANRASLVNYKPGHYLPWYRVLKALSHTDLPALIFQHLAQNTGISLFYIRTNPEQQALDIIPAAIEYSLNYDKSRAVIVQISDFLNENRLRAIKNGIQRAVLAHLHTEIYQAISPDSLNKRNLEPTVRRYVQEGQIDRLTPLDRQVIILIVRAIFALLSGVLDTRFQPVIPSLTGSHSLCLGQVFENLLDTDYLEAAQDFNFDQPDGFQTLDVVITHHHFKGHDNNMSREEQDLEDLLNQASDDEEENMDYEDEMPDLPPRVGCNLYNFIMTSPCDYDDTNTLHSDEVYGEYYEYQMQQRSSHLIEVFLRRINVSYNNIVCMLQVLINDPSHPDLFIALQRVSLINLLHTELQVINAPIVACGQKLRREYQRVSASRIQRQLVQSEQHLLSHVFIRNRHIAIRVEFRGGYDQPWDGSPFSTRQEGQMQVIHQGMTMRPYGIYTFSYTAILELAHLLQWNRIQNPIRIAAFGVGFGGDITALSHIFPGSDIFVTTTVEGGYSSVNVHSFPVQGQAPPNLIDAHNEISYDDILEPRTTEYLIDTGATGINLIWCDIDMFQNENNEVLNTYYYNVYTYYKRAKALGCTLVVRMNGRYTDAVLRFVSSLLTENGTMILYKPSSMRHCMHFYLIWYDQTLTSQPMHRLDYNALPLFQMHKENIDGLLERGFDRLDSWSRGFNREISTRVHLELPWRGYMIASPPLFVSLYNQVANIVITQSMIRAMTQHFTPRDQFAPYPHTNRPTHYIFDNLVIPYMEKINGYMTQLDEEAMGGADSNNLILPASTQASRILIIGKILILLGMKFVHDTVKNRTFNQVFSIIEANSYFMDAMSRFDYRDTHVPRRGTYHHMIDDNHSINTVKTEYYANFCRGVNTALVMVGWVYYINKHIPGQGNRV
ncbi:MAG: RNA-dependent RNA polymerase [Hangzhou chuvirus 3]|nr:MAG: RNA-dependent RNA polymerase [Hangzhou chuvirus 3]